MKTIYLGFAAVLASAACGDNGGNDNTSNPNTSGVTNPGPGPGTSDGETIPQADCTSRCEAHATACDVPEAMVSQICGNICADSLTEAAIQCIEDLPCTAGEDELDECVNKNPPDGSSDSDGPTDTGGPSPGGFGDPCTCGMTSGEWECSGSNICSTGLVCVGSGNDAGTCRGPVCCDSESDCAEKLGKQANCDTGQKCTCPGGYLECVGEECTCEGGALTNRGLCYPDLFQ